MWYLFAYVSGGTALCFMTVLSQTYSVGSEAMLLDCAPGVWVVSWSELSITVHNWTPRKVVSGLSCCMTAKLKCGGLRYSPQARGVEDSGILLIITFWLQIFQSCSSDAIPHWPLVLVVLQVFGCFQTFLGLNSSSPSMLFCPPPRPLCKAQSRCFREIVFFRLFLGTGGLGQSKQHINAPQTLLSFGRADVSAVTGINLRVCVCICTYLNTARNILHLDVCRETADARQ